MITTKQIELTFNLGTDEERTIDLEVTLDYDWENDGIGAYEYWGAKGYDAGSNYVVINDWSFDHKDFTDTGIAEINSAIEHEIPKWEVEIAEESAKDEPDYTAEDEE